MLPAERLPPELWLIIFDLARGSGPRQYCNYLTFPHLNLHLRRPSEYRFTIDVWPRTVRLTCRYFNSLLEQPPPFFMKDADSAIPDATRMLYILPQRDPGPQACFQRLLADPSIASRITLLNLPGYEGSVHSSPTNFDFLCDNADSLRAVRSLTLCVRIPGAAAPAIPNFWWRLNNAFPLLTSLVLCGGVSTTYPREEVVFKYLEVMDWDLADYYVTLQFPALRHVSFNYVHSYQLEYLAELPHLESLVIRGFIQGEFEWGLFPNLRLLGLPDQLTTTLPLLPPNHPLQHLYVFVGARPPDNFTPYPFNYEVGLTWLTETLKSMPTITRLSLCLDKHLQNHLDSISGNFREEDVELLGFTQREFPAKICENGYHIIFERVKVETVPPKAESTTSGEPVSQRRGFRFGWNKFAQSTSRKLHL